MYEDNPQVMGNSASKAKNHNNSPQSYTPCLMSWVKDKRKIDPVQILHGIGLNWHAAIHPQIVEGVQGPQGILQIRF